LTSASVASASPVTSSAPTLLKAISGTPVEALVTTRPEKVFTLERRKAGKAADRDGNGGEKKAAGIGFTASRANGTHMGRTWDTRRFSEGSVLRDVLRNTFSRPQRVASARGAGAQQLVENIRVMVHAACGPVVSCADILALATRDAVNLAGGPFFRIPLGRRDSFRPTSPAEINTLPPPSTNVDTLLAIFRRRGLDDAADLVALSGGHTVGKAGCSFIRANDDLLHQAARQAVLGHPVQEAEPRRRHAGRLRQPVLRCSEEPAGRARLRPGPGRPPAHPALGRRLRGEPGRLLRAVCQVHGQDGQHQALPEIRYLPSVGTFAECFYCLKTGFYQSFPVVSPPSLQYKLKCLAKRGILVVRGAAGEIRRNSCFRPNSRIGVEDGEGHAVSA
ncbi:hypothetical protein EJB05_31075, partial [Eragrostis curvula]